LYRATNPHKSARLTQFVFSVTNLLMRKSQIQSLRVHGVLLASLLSKKARLQVQDEIGTLGISTLSGLAANNHLTFGEVDLLSQL